MRRLRSRLSLNHWSVVCAESSYQSVSSPPVVARTLTRWSATASRTSLATLTASRAARRAAPSSFSSNVSSARLAQLRTRTVRSSTSLRSVPSAHRRRTCSASATSARYRRTCAADSTTMPFAWSSVASVSSSSARGNRMDWPKRTSASRARRWSSRSSAQKASTSRWTPAFATCAPSAPEASTSRAARRSRSAPAPRSASIDARLRRSSAARRSRFVATMRPARLRAVSRLSRTSAR